MNYEFLQKAQSEPDLTDFCEYLKKPLLVLEEIKSRYEKLQLNKQVESSNLENYHKVNTILEKHLPKMVDNFCDFSFEFRNNEKIKIENIFLTPKELLLLNLAKIIEEVKLIEKEFNYNNSFQTIAQTKILSSYGFKPELSLETGEIKHEKVKLTNKFDYDKFVESNDFKQPIKKDSINYEVIANKEIVISHPVSNINNTMIEPINKEKLIPQSIVEKNLDLVPQVKQKGNIKPIEEEYNGEVKYGGMMILAFFIFAVWSVSSAILGTSPAESKPNRDFSSRLALIQLRISESYKPEEFTKLSNEKLIQSRVLTSQDLLTPWGSVIEINDDSLGQKMDGKYTLTFNMVSAYSKNNYKGNDCENVAFVANNYSMVSFAQYVVKSEANNIGKEDFINYCEGDMPPGLKFPTNSVTLVSK